MFFEGERKMELDIKLIDELLPVTQVTQVLLNAGTQPDQMSVDQIRHLLVGEERRSRIGRN